MVGKVTSFALIVFLFSSCTVLEDRGDCPCLLHLDFDESAAAVADSVRIWVRGDGFNFTSGLSSSNYSEGITITVTSRSGVYVTVMDSASAQDSPDGSLAIAPGCQCPQVYDFRAFCDTSGETAREYVSLHKNHCRVLLSFPEAMSGGYSVEIAGRACGYSGLGDILDGDFSCIPSADGKGLYVFCIPRQKDALLNMSIGTDEGLPRIFALGNFIMESGYDWTAGDLEDVEVEVDYAASPVRLDIEGWPERDASDIVI